MIAILIISPSQNVRASAIEEELKKNDLTRNHPDLLYFQTGEKLGIAEARKIKEHFSLKPYSSKGRIAILEDASTLTTEAQNALLKTIEELPKEAILILGAASDANLLPTVLSRCKILNLGAKSYDTLEYYNKYFKDAEKLLKSSIEERFEYIEKLKDRAELLPTMSWYFHKLLLQKITKHDVTVQASAINIKEFLKELLQAEKWAKQNVNIRAILEYLMLVMPNEKVKS